MAIFTGFSLRNFSFCLFLAGFGIISDGHAQLTVSQGGTAQAMATAIVGQGVIVSNATIDCPAQSYGTFNGSSTNIGLTSGIMLTTGFISNVANPASVQLNDATGTSGSDPDLVAIYPADTINTCILQFDIIPICDTLKLTYVFASEEYPDYVCSQYNDAFGFFISGPNPAGGNYTSKNIALIPGSNVAVAINSVNGGSVGINGAAGGCGGPGDPGLNNTGYYVNNSAGGTIAYNGFTVPLTASVPVVMCQTYHLKLAIADAVDQIFDSGVFLEQSGLSCPGTSVSITATGDTAGEGCLNGSILITRGGDLTSSLVVNLSFSGTATNGADYTLTNSVTFGTGQSTISLNVPAIADGISEGTEIATITGSYNICGTTATITPVNITITEGPVISFSTVDPGCGGSTGTITATPAGGTAPYTYLWSTTPAQTAVTATGLPAGNYSVTVTDANNCVSDSTISLGTTPSLNLTTTSTPVACNGGTNGTATVTASSGTTPYTYQWSTTPVQNSATATGLAAGNYTVTVNDNAGCQNTITVAVNSQSAVVLSTSSVDVTCAGGNDGTASVSASGGNTPYTYLWSNSGNTPGITSLIAGTYAVTVNDNNNCPVTASVIINDGAPIPNATISPLGPFCDNDPPANLTAATGGGVFTGTGVSGTTFSPVATGAGTHIVTYTIAGACGSSDTVSIVVNAVPDATINAVSPQCETNSPVSLTAATNGGAWSGTGVTGNSFNPSAAGAGTFTITYSLTVAGCAAADTVLITVNPGYDASITAAGPFCISSPSVNLSAVSPGGTWSGNGITSSSAGTFDPSAAGTGNHVITYSITATCGDTGTTTISVSEVTIDSQTTTDNSCFGACDGSITLNTTGATQFSIDNGTTFQSGNVFGNLCFGNYPCLVQNSMGCSDTVMLTITQPTGLSLNNFLSVSATCYDSCNGYAVVIPSGGTSPYYYNWTPTGGSPPVGSGAGTASAGKLCNGTYNLQITDNNGCVNDTNFSISEPAEGFVISSSVQTLCYGSCDGSATATAFGGTGSGTFTFQWDNNAASQTTDIATGLCAGNYLVTATDANQCPVVTSVIVSQPLPVTITVSADTTICIGTGTVVSVTNTSGGIGSYQFAWDNGFSGNSQMVTPTSSTCYSVTASDGNGCLSAPQTVCVGFFPPLVATASPDLTICRGSMVDLSAMAVGGDGFPYSFFWNNGQQGSTISVYPPGDFPDTVNYFVIASDGCSPNDTDSVQVTFFQIEPVSYTPPSAMGCEPYTATFTNLTPNAASCLWDLGDGTFVDSCGTFQYTYTNAGNYIVDLTVYSNDGCATTISPASFINVNPNPFASFSYLPEDPTVVNTLVSFTSTSTGPITVYDWTFMNIDNSVLGTSQNVNPTFTFPSDTGLYPVNLQVTTLSGCTDDTTIYIYVDNEFSLWIPNTFTPNGDGENDFFPPIGIGINPDRFVLYIFDRWGDLIFESHNLNDPWDGTAREVGGTEIVKQDVYVWKIVTEEATRERTPHKYVGHVVLLR